MGELDAGAAIQIDFGAEIDRLGRATTDLRTALDAAFDLHAIPLSTNGSAIAAAGVRTLIDVGGPAVGRFWEVVALTVIGSDDHTVLAGTNVAFYAGIPAAAGNLADIVLPGTQGGAATTVPANAQFSRRQIVIPYPQHAYFLIYGASAGQSLSGNLRGWDRDVSELPLR